MCFSKKLWKLSLMRFAFGVHFIKVKETKSYEVCVWGAFPKVEGNQVCMRFALGIRYEVRSL